MLNIKSLGDRLNLAYSGATSGVAIATGRNRLGHIHDMMSVIKTAKTPLLLQIDMLGMICFDKTTTLTINEMAVKAVLLAPCLIHLKKRPVRRAFFIGGGTLCAIT